jgi:hypothetical protein
MSNRIEELKKQIVELKSSIVKFYQEGKINAARHAGIDLNGMEDELNQLVEAKNKEVMQQQQLNLFGK